MKGADCIVCTVHLWFTSVLPLLLAAEAISFVKHTTERQVTKSPTTGEVVVQFSKDSHIQLVLAVSMAVFLFCLHGLRVLWPKCFEGELPQHDVDCRSNWWGILIVWQAIGSVLFSCLAG
jgi:hypothetical protein